jgi:hypothetical protein
VQPEIWAYCNECLRWVYCERWFDREAADPTCPVCKADPVAIENRAAGRQGVPIRR